MKNTIDDLGIFGGQPAFRESIHVGRPNIGCRERLLERIDTLLDRRWLTNQGPYVQELERNLCELLGVKNCVLMCNATIALEIAIRALGLKGEVIVPSFTFVATAHSLQWQEITPVFCDIDPLTHNLNPNAIEKMITPRTSGIIGVHVWGRPCPVDQLQQIANRYNLKLMFDAAHAFGCSLKGKYIGNFGEAEVFSFHATKFFNTFEGGAVVTNNDELAHKMRLMTNFGFAGYDNVIYLGTNGKMSEISAAMGLTSLECMEEIIHANYRNYKQYQSELRQTPGIKQVEFDDEERNNYHYIILEIDESIAGVHRDMIVDILHAENVLARRYFYPGCHRMEPYASYFPHAGMLLPETESLTSKTISLPNGTSICSEDISEICHIIRFASSNSPAIRKRLQVSIPENLFSIEQV
jgi:dTDP-4-amino-4,6-dideoxygalactose transaminase